MQPMMIMLFRFGEDILICLQSSQYSRCLHLYLLLVPVLDVDSQEGESEHDAAGGGHTQDGVHRRLHPGLFVLGRGHRMRGSRWQSYPYEGPVLGGLRPVVEDWPGDLSAALHVEGAGHSGVLPDTLLRGAWGGEG